MKHKNVLKTIVVLAGVIGGLGTEGFVRPHAAEAQDISQATSDQPESLRALQQTVIRRNDVTGDQPASLRALQQTTLQRYDATGDQSGSVEGFRSSGSTVPTATPTDSTLPSPEARSEAIALVTPMDGQLMISLTNNTGATVTYEVVGDTSRRTLEASESITLQGISLPSTITLVRQDEGLLDVSADSTAVGMLSLSISAESGLDDTQGVIRIQEDGRVFAN